MRLIIIFCGVLIIFSCGFFKKSQTSNVDSTINGNSTINVSLLSGEQLDTLNLFELSDNNSKKLINQALDLIKSIDTIFKTDTNRIELYLQIKDNDTIFRVPNYNNVPESYKASYNIIKDKNGKIIYISECPYSESGDWNLEMQHYYSVDGSLLAFIGRYSTFVSECTEIAYEESKYFYDNDFKLIKKTYSLMDKNNKKLNNKDCYIGKEEYKIEKKLDDYLKVHIFK